MKLTTHTSSLDQYHAFWKDGYSGKNQGFIDLGVLPGDNQSVALGLNNYGHAVGYSLNTSTGNQRAVVWFSNGVMWDLTAQVGAANGWVFEECPSHQQRRLDSRMGRERRY